MGNDEDHKGVWELACGFHRLGFGISKCCCLYVHGEEVRPVIMGTPREPWSCYYQDPICQIVVAIGQGRFISYSSFLFSIEIERRVFWNMC